VRPRRVAQILAAVIACAACVAWLDSPLRPPATRRMQMLGVAPQFWGYFAAPQEGRLQVYRWRDGAWVQLDAPLGSASNLLGLQRGPVHHSSEFRALLSQIGTRWADARVTSTQLPDDPGPTLELKNLAREPQLCGDVLFIERRPVPWAWARSSARVAMPAKVARLRVQC